MIIRFLQTVDLKESRIWLFDLMFFLPFLPATCDIVLHQLENNRDIPAIGNIVAK
jgi:hypothetical protein